ncbi:TadE/TadG family type IV pilus assembly protein [Actinacidiphila bryophytorum]|uniref:Septum determining protein n=1 Tax=Actinacidiphila bryophytorum TaxID=1436133 RepID=A0A9W4H0R4_9ACTN|nr:TadE/TadG family type IV pilus assembly protein [Actinacidiphila bryophytorum]MBM9439415.1 pilus assembly protein [Actinacidiphila bryophytorum]MBN6544772.1 pilus assembly protein [Actinacidiphila bryophytorum]CAG7639099.1 Septum determining protein [Actinacidiphila bryophytorum]
MTTLTAAVARLRGRAQAAPAAEGTSGADAGISTIEIVILAPLLILFILVLVAFGQLVDGRGALDGAARDAARAGSLQGERGAADRAALQAATDDLQGICEGAVHMTTDGTDWTAQGGHYAVQLSCTVRGLAVVGLSIPTTMSSQFAAPLDPYRRYE